MADNFSDKVVKKLQKQNLAVDLTEEVVEEAAPETAPEVAPEEVAVQSQDFQAMTANSGNPGTGIKDIVVIPGGGTAQTSTSQINFYWEKPTTQGVDNTDAFLRSSIYNYVEGADGSEEPVLAIGGYNGTHYAPAATYGGGSGQQVARIWFHPFSGTVDAAKLVLEQTANTGSIQFGTGTVTQTTTTKGHLGWTGTRLVIGDGSAPYTIAYTSDIAGFQNIFQTMSDGTNTSVADTSTDTFRFRGSNGVTVLVTNDEAVFGDNLLISLSGVPNAALANSSITIGSTGIALGGTAATLSGLTSLASGILTAGNIRINSVTNTIDTSSNTLTLTSANNTVNITATNVTLAGTSATSLSANNNKIINVTDPSNPQDAATKAYVDAVKVGLDVHESVRCVIVAQIAGNYVQANLQGSSSSGVATITYSATGATVIDTNVTLALNDRVLVTGGLTAGSTVTAASIGITNPSDTEKFAANGIYYVSTAGATGVATVLTRALDTDDNVELEGGTFTFVQEGLTYADTGWVCTTNTSSTGSAITFAPNSGTTGRITFTQFTGAGGISVVAPIVKNVNELSLALKANGGLVVESNALAVNLGASALTGTLTVGDGGTGQTTLTSNGVLFGAGTSGISVTSQGTAGQILIANGSNIPAFTSIGGDAASLSGTGVLALATTTVTAASYGSATQVATFTVDAKGRLTAAANAAIPTAAAATLGLASFSSTHFTVTSGAVTLNTVGVTVGGTGLTSAVTGLLYGNGTGYAAATAANINSSYGNQNANIVLAGPTSGGAATPGFRSLVVADLPTVTIAKGGTNATGQTSSGITYFDGTSITSGSALTWLPSNSTATGASSTLYVNAASVTTGTAMHLAAGAMTGGNALFINAGGGAFTAGKLIDAQNNGTSKFSVDYNGNLRATTKSFDIPHPTKEGMRLVYGVLEGPEHGVYHRGTVEGKDKIKIELPEYWYKLVGENYSVQLTSWGPYAVHLVEKTENYFVIQLSSNFVMRKFKTIKVDYVVHGARLDAPLEIEQ